MNDIQKVFINNLEYYMSQKGISRKEFAKEVDIPYSTVCSWFNEYKFPHHKSLPAIADYFGVSVTELITPRTDKSVSAITDDVTQTIEILQKKTERLKELVNKASNLTVTQIECLITMATTLLEQ